MGSGPYFDRTEKIDKGYRANPMALDKWFKRPTVKSLRARISGEHDFISAQSLGSVGELLSPFPGLRQSYIDGLLGWFPSERDISKQAIATKKRITKRFKQYKSDIEALDKQAYKQKGDVYHVLDVNDLKNDLRGFYPDDPDLELLHLDYKNNAITRTENIDIYYDDEMDSIKRSFSHEVHFNTEEFKAGMLYKTKISDLNEVEGMLRHRYINQSVSSDDIYDFIDSYVPSTTDIKHYETHIKKPWVNEKASVREFISGSIEGDRREVNKILKQLSINRRLDKKAAVQSEKRKSALLNKTTKNKNKIKALLDDIKKYKAKSPAAIKKIQQSETAFGRKKTKLLNDNDRLVKNYLKKENESATQILKRDRSIRMMRNTREEHLKMQSNLQNISRNERDMIGVMRGQKYTRINKEILKLEESIYKYQERITELEIASNTYNPDLTEFVDGPKLTIKLLRSKIDRLNKIKQGLIKSRGKMPDYEALIRNELRVKFSRLEEEKASNPSIVAHDVKAASRADDIIDSILEHEHDPLLSGHKTLLKSAADSYSKKLLPGQTPQSKRVSLSGFLDSVRPTTASPSIAHRLNDELLQSLEASLPGKTQVQVHAPPPLTMEQAALKHLDKAIEEMERENASEDVLVAQSLRRTQSMTSRISPTRFTDL